MNPQSTRNEVDVTVAEEQRSRLLAWYDRRRRDLPWRSTRDPYRILVSEVMLQQTRVEVVLPRYRRFLERFPNVDRLAAASIDDVLAEWSGLGYYSRARRLHRCALEIVRRGGFPRRAEELRQLPGIGAYTAAAVASIAFDERVPVLDGNVERVLTRLLAEDRSPRRAAVRRELISVAAELLDAERPGDSNQALMELGATVCRPRRPDCASCVLAAACRGRLGGNPTSFPKLGRAERTERRRWSQLLVRDGQGRLLLVRRSRDAPFLAGSWGLPTLEHRMTALPTPSSFSSRTAGDRPAIPRKEQESKEQASEVLEPRMRRRLPPGALDLEDGDSAERCKVVRPEKQDHALLLAQVQRRLGAPLEVVAPLRSLGMLRHAVTYRRLEIEVIACHVDRSGQPPEADERADVRWLFDEQLANVHTSSMLNKALALERKDIDLS